MYNIIKQLEGTRSKNEKQDILVENKDNMDLFHYFNYSLNPYIKFNIRKVPKYEQKEVTKSINDAFELLDTLATGKLRGKKATEEVKEMLEHLSEEDALLFKRMLTKTAGVGVSIKSYNKSVGDKAIPIFGCMLYEKYTEDKQKKLSPPYYLQLKSDGARAESLVTDVPSYMTRKGNKYIMNVPEIDSYLLAIKNKAGTDVMIDGEMVAVDENGFVKREKSNGLVNKAIAGTLSDEEAKTLKFVIWDIVPLDSFYEGEYDSPYSERYKWLTDLVSEVGSSDKVEVSETNIYEDLQDALDKAEEYIISGQEGALIKSHNSIWEDKRVSSCLKIKAENDCDLVVVGYEHGDPNKGLEEGIGSLVFSTSCGKLRVNVSSGMSMEDRGYIKNENGDYVFDKSFDLDKYNNKIGKISFASLTESSKTGKPSLFTPVLVEFRGDKDEADSLDDILGD